MSISIVNNWKSVYRTKRPELPYLLPPVAVVVCTYKEPVEIVKRTIKSLLRLTYGGKVAIILSNDAQDPEIRNNLTEMINEVTIEANKNNNDYSNRNLYLFNTEAHGFAKAGNLNQVLKFLEKVHPEINLLLTQDADEKCHPDILEAIVGYFTNPMVSYVQTIKQSAVSQEDPFGNRDLMWYLRTAPSRDSVNSMFACGSGVMWKISALKSIGGFSTWNLVEDLTTSYKLLSAGWQGRYHYEALSKGLAPEDLPNYIKQRGTWALDHLRIFFWDNPFKKRTLSFRQKLQFIEPSLFYLNGFFNLILMLVTSLSLIFEIWPTTKDAATHAKYLIPSFLALEVYYLLLAESIPFRRERQFWVGLAPVFSLAAIKAYLYGPDRKPTYKVTRKENVYGNYFIMVLPQIMTLVIIGASLLRILIYTPLYSQFDWAAVFWGFYQASFFLQPIKVSIWKWDPKIKFDLFWGNEGRVSAREVLNIKNKIVRSFAG